MRENREAIKAINFFQEPAVRLSQIGFILLATVCLLESSLAGEDRTLLQIEQRAHLPRRAVGKKQLWREVADGVATKEEKQELLDLYKALAKLKPPRGSQESWEKRTAALVTAAEEIVSGEAKGADKLRAAVSCKACHDAHRGPDPAIAADGTRVEEAGSFANAAPPQFVKVSNVSKDKLNITVYHYEPQEVIAHREVVEEADGKSTIRKESFIVKTNVLRQTQITMQYVRLFDSAGKEIKGDDVWNRLKPGVTLLRQTDAKDLDPQMLKLLSTEALILAPSVLETPPAGK